ncbi:WXG100 family type VII secretion target [Brachybacterium sp. J153]|uniref:WXG100 family type VII secretion target n=1 Tax=Brachybacterium sp. J153 TaxID=3116488 RepID=UPI002E780DB3|nr:hypothetical protein [Brachybacterium sp. J153]MEE1619154.1 hypothetical protein [Brachybacterium sp. J153]
MTSIWGSDPTAMDELAETILERAEQLRELFDRLRERTAALRWEGPDAEAHRARFGQVDGDLLAACRALDERGAQIREEAAEQERASAADGLGDPLAGVRAGFPPRGGSIPPSLPGSDPVMPEVGGPMAHHDPIGLFRDLEDRVQEYEAEHGPLGPLIGGPFAAPLDPGALHGAYGPGELPEGEAFAPDGSRLEEAEADRRLWLSKIPVVGDVASLPTFYEAGEGYYDAARHRMEEAGLGAYTGGISLVQIGHDLGGAALGERSMLAQYIDGVDRGIANVSQTTADVSTAIGDRDLGGVVRAVERGGFRHAEIAVDTVTANPLPSAVEAVASASGHLGEGIAPFSPEAAARLEQFEQNQMARLERDEARWQAAIDAETWYDRRRSAVRMPWDPR